ncbi:MAG: O-antigen ligase family protein [Candidatus Moraniibacteriota bacterium]
MNGFSSRLTVFVLAMLFFALPFSQARVMLFDIPLYVTEFLILIATVLFSVALAKKERHVRPVPPLLVVGFGLILVGIVLSSVLSSGMSSQELGAIKSWVVFPAIFGFLLFQVTERKELIRMILSFWYASVLVVASVSWLPGVFSAITYDGRLMSLFPSPNHLSFFLLPGILIGSYFLAILKSLRMQAVSVLATGIIFIALYRTQSQGALLSSLFGVSILIITEKYGKRAVKRLLVGSVVLLICISGYLVASGEWSRLSTGEIRTPLASRVMIWNAAFSMLRTHPLFGIGPRNFQDEYLVLQKAFPPYLEWTAPHPHDVFLSFWLSGGALSLIGYGILIVYTFKNALSGLSLKDPPTRMISILSLSLLAAIVLHGLVDDTYFRNDLSLVFWTVIVLSCVTVADTEKTVASVATV